MINEDKECLAVLTQIKAVKAGLSSVMDKYIMENMDGCLKKGAKNKELLRIKKLISELTKK